MKTTAPPPAAACAGQTPPNGICRRRRWAGAAVAGVVLLLAFGFQNRPLYGGDEGRYTAVALELLRTRDPWRLQLSEGQPHLTKPPLLHASIAAAVAAFGRREWAARLPNSLAYGLTAALLWRLARRLRFPRPWLAPLVYGTCALPFAAASVITTDTLLAFWETAAVAAFAAARFDPRGGRGASCLPMWAAFGAAFLTKGPPALLPLAAVLLFEQLSGDRAGLRRILAAPGWLLFAAVGAGWYLLADRVHPGLLAFWLRHEVAARLTASRALHGDEVSAVFTVSLATLLAGTLPWTWVLLRPAGRWLARARRHGRRAWAEGDPAALFLLVWFALPAAVFFLLPNRQPLYLLPSCAPLALLPARFLGRVRWRGWMFGALGLWCALLLSGRALSVRLLPKPDHRRLAEAVARLAPDATRLCFVDFRNPWFGLRWYRDLPVENVAWEPPPAPVFNGPQRSAPQALAQSAGGTCFVVKAEDRERFDALAARQGRRLLARGVCHGAWLLLAAP